MDPNQENVQPEEQPRKRQKVSTAPKPAPHRKLARNIQADLAEAQAHDAAGEPACTAPAGEVGQRCRRPACTSSSLLKPPCDAAAGAAADSPSAGRDQAWFDPSDATKVRLLTAANSVMCTCQA